MIYRLILPEWARQGSTLPSVVEGEFSQEQLEKYNEDGYNCYYLPNYPSTYDPAKIVDGLDIDTFEYVYVDLDLKDYKNSDPERAHNYESKEQFMDAVLASNIQPTAIVDSGNGLHVYWAVSDLDAMSFLRFQRRLKRKFNTDPAVAKIYQLMRVPGTVNTKNPDDLKLSQVIFSSDAVYTGEQLDGLLPPILSKDETYCKQHHDKTYRLSEPVQVDEKLPHKFAALLKSSAEVKQIFIGDVKDRSTADYRLAHIMFAQGFTRDEAMSVLINCRKALDRAPHHRVAYAQNIVEKVWVFEESNDKDSVALSSSVRDILKRLSAKKGTPFRCHEIFDSTDHGFHLTEVLGLIGGAGSGKTTLALNYFYWFTKANPDYVQVFVSLEQPEEEIAARWAKLAANEEHLHDKVHVLGNYNADGSYRNLSLHEIQQYILELETKNKVKVGCVVIDHIGVLKKESKDGEAQGLMDICHGMKAFAKATNTFLIMQSQTSRDKAGIGDLELNKDAAYGTSMFEWYCDYVVTTWQPLKRIYDQKPDMTCTVFKYCKIRHKNILLDKTREDVPHVVMFDPTTERLSVDISNGMTDSQFKAFTHWNAIANGLINRDRKREPTQIKRIEWGGIKSGKPDNHSR